jgi:hypothetical protein
MLILDTLVAVVDTVVEEEAVAVAAAAAGIRIRDTAAVVEQSDSSRPLFLGRRWTTCSI